MTPSKALTSVLVFGLFMGGLRAQDTVCPNVTKYGAECPMDVDNECLSDQECSAGRKCCPSPFDDEACQLLCLEPEPQKSCPVSVDFAFILDGSGSISRNNWGRIKDFVKQIIDSFGVSPEGTHFALLEYSDEPKVYLRFNDFTGAQLNVVNVKRKVEEIIQSGGKTFIDKALILANQEIFTQESGMRPGVKKMALVLTDGTQTPEPSPGESEENLISAAQLLHDKGIDVLALGIGKDVNPFQLLNIASDENNLYVAKVFDEILDVVDELAKRECLSCSEPVDVVFGIPTSQTIPADQFQSIKNFVSQTIDSFDVGPMKVHVGIVTYSGSALTTLEIDQLVSKEVLDDFTNKLTQQGRQVNVVSALDEAFRSTFSIFGGVRQSKPKSFVLLVPEGSVSSRQEVLNAAARLKSLGVRLLTVGIGRNIDQNLYELASTQPPSKFFYDVPNHSDLNAKSRDVAEVICKGNVGKCPLLPPPPPNCPEGLEHECDVDADCKMEGGQAPLCCVSNCGGRQCLAQIKSCFVPVDIAIAVENSDIITNNDFNNIKRFLKQLVRRFASPDIRISLLEYGNSATVLADFRKSVDQISLENLIDSIGKSSDSERNVDIALETVKEKIFSLEGGMRPGYPRYLIFVSSGDSTTDFSVQDGPGKQLRDLDVTFVAIGTSRNVPGEFLQKIAGDSRFIYSAEEASELGNLVLGDLSQQMCSEKPGKCPDVLTTPDPLVCQVEQPDPETTTLCGLSANGSGSSLNYDWDCPGESKCCLDPLTGCFQVCLNPQNVCNKQFDLTIVMENSALIGEEAFDKVKDFAKQFVSAFDIRDGGTRVAVVSYGTRPIIHTRLNSYSGPALNTRTITDDIDGIEFQSASGGPASTSSAFTEVLNTVYADGNGAKNGTDKTVVLITAGKFSAPDSAVDAAIDIRAQPADLFAVVIGEDPDVSTLAKVVSLPVENNVFMASSSSALQPLLRALTDTVCEGAEKMTTVIGPPGDPGEPGRPGSEGPPGPRGDPGDAGEAGEPGDPGSPGPPGPPGRPGGGGFIGPPGPPGEKGPSNIMSSEKGPVVAPVITSGVGRAVQGDPGPPGRRGAPGPRGVPGIAGVRGTIGSRGPPGNDGFLGPIGLPGRRGLPGEAGKRGNAGLPGEPGSKGPIGDSGADGRSGLKGPRGHRGSIGPTGDRGEEGETGMQGLDGSPGADGKPGKRGARGSLGKPGSTGAPGSSGSKGGEGTEGIQGPSGPPGPPGTPGLTGQKGENGRHGRAGYTGYQGDSGDMGPIGPQGNAGLDGETGETGPTGGKGYIGDTGPSGEIGEKGPDGKGGRSGNGGPRGFQGSTGDPGTPGERGELGAKGKPGRTGMPGGRGIPGPRGKRGAAGDPGAQGVTGIVGSRGSPGPQGYMGPNGQRGIKGGSGMDGPRGDSGRQGERGDIGDYGTYGAPGEQGPRGVTGRRGRPGSPGMHGEEGDSGSPGEDGPPGGPGGLGTAGLSGIKGEQGKPGEDGEQGEAGPEGPKGGLGPTGTIGVPGHPGNKGPGGEIGEGGDPGVPGEVGTEGSSGSKGQDGSPGAKGSKGDDGLNGVPGSRGRVGTSGDKGAGGTIGAPGISGERGDQGRPGKTGTPGTIGEPGDQGTAGRVGSLGLSGPTGDLGSKGEMGLRGAHGDRGKRGSNGQPGNDGLPGSRGAKGDSGEKGMTGDPGLPGIPGGNGDSGTRGDQGTQGNPGFEGPEGHAGPVGSRGSPGNPGIKGSTGEQGLAGPTGEQGPEGAPGYQGGKGFQGDRGPLGGSGAPGGIGSQGPTGPSGELGSAGRPGLHGKPGEQGSRGDRGVPGSRGEDGRPGLPGPNGVSGSTGQSGLQGQRGNTGPAGPPGQRGQQGLSGVRGARGITGEGGSKGDVGEPGATGKDGTIGKLGEVGLPGSRGSPGDVGNEGRAGPPGTIGNPGSDGFKGEAGLHGSQGKTGTPGKPGVAGPPGPRGGSGPSGTDGQPGQTGGRGPIGVIGETGDIGEPGELGAVGIGGEKGDRGEPGQQGPSGNSGQKGPEGDFGKRGGIGPVGARGEDGIQGSPGPEGPQGSQGTEGPLGFSGERGDPGNRGLEGQRGPPGQPGPPGPLANLGALGAFTQRWNNGGFAGSQETQTEKAKLYRSFKDQSEKPVLDPVKITLALLHYKLELYKKPNGTKEFPARTCKDLIMCYPGLHNGEFWVDPNEGITEDAIKVYCDFSFNATCLYSSKDKKPFASKKKKWYSGRDEYKWLGEDLGTLQKIKYVKDSSQLLFLRLLSDRARQNITYHCKDSVAWYDQQLNDVTKSLRIKTNNGVIIDSSSSNKFKPSVLTDNCRVKNGTWLYTIIQVDTSKPNRLPILDVAAYDVGDDNEEFGLEVGPVCFY